MRVKSAADWGLPTWPEDKPFPLTAEECLALCKGDLVRTEMTVDEASDAFQFRFEMFGGWIILKRRD